MKSVRNHRSSPCHVVLFLAFAMCLLFAAGAIAQVTLHPASAARGDIVAADVTGLATNSTVIVNLCPGPDGDCTNARRATVERFGPNGIKFTVDANTVPGSYKVRVTIDGKEQMAETALKVEPPMVKSAAATSINTGNSRGYELVVNGTGFAAGANAADNVLLFDGTANNRRIQPCTATAAAGTSQAGAQTNSATPPHCVRIEASDDGRQLIYTGLFPGISGNTNIAVAVGGTSPGPKTYAPVLFPVESAFSLTVQIVLKGAAILGIFGGGMYIAIKGLKLLGESMGKIPRRQGGATPARWYETLLIDPRTNTYSLASFQFALWSMAFLLAYLWLFAGRVFVQHNPDFVDLPSDFATMLGATAGTAVVATAIDASKGSKGAGEIHPALSDLVSNGGVFAPERFQFLIWTIVAVSGYLILTFSYPLDIVAGLPQVGTNILSLSGISGLAYLGGKLTRTAGPVITAVAPVPGTPAAAPVHDAAAAVGEVRRVAGQQLSLDAGAAYIVKDAAGAETRLVAGGGGVVAVVPQGATSGFATAVDVTLPPGFLFPGTITLINIDQQKAVMPVLAYPPLIDTVAAPPGAAAGGLVRRLTGQQFSLDQGVAYIVKNAAGTETTLPAGSVTAVTPPGATSGFASVVDVTFPAGFVFPGMITVINPDQQRAGIQVP